MKKSSGNTRNTLSKVNEILGINDSSHQSQTGCWLW